MSQRLERPPIFVLSRVGTFQPLHTVYLVYMPGPGTAKQKKSERQVYNLIERYEANIYLALLSLVSDHRKDQGRYFFER